MAPDSITAQLDELVARGMERREARWLIEEFASLNDSASQDDLQDAIGRRLAGEPLQYVLGHWPFRDLDLDVDERVLIPRPETEELVEIALEWLIQSRLTSPLILDLGCGSGAIGLALLGELTSRNIAATVIGLDVSDDALMVARANADKHGLRDITFVKSSWFSELDNSLRGRVDLIVANPPYVGALELRDLDPVLRYEPRGALVSADFEGVVGFADLNSIIIEAPRWLSPGGVLICEHANHQGAATRDTAIRAQFASARTVKDVAHLDRILFAELAP